LHTKVPADPKLEHPEPAKRFRLPQTRTRD
jgi:hypothetical protein